MAARWKLASELDTERNCTIILAFYGDDKMPIKRYTATFHENDADSVVATVLRVLAEKIEGGLE